MAVPVPEPKPVKHMELPAEPTTPIRAKSPSGELIRARSASFKEHAEPHTPRKTSGGWEINSVTV